ncbi:putative ABC transport system substrate-binding protein [Georgenia satyanarayanai]|uniref:Putative ABC transport system substrate-binding protein n=1 Tax=Georgenia satyanarayanai TaxID=860221 RepID=A0A2Y9AIS9_9MICO|nr:ABC transporter substrate-binding protein [Georgenia satyanarayanai]PYF99093.1 putative ABC transport system substrate-binding protein [Georgenia satyanarayanai]SSA44055.1 putative ABC transport system substrate-binding protein [Georgenia satyanarayanai]
MTRTSLRLAGALAASALLLAACGSDDGGSGDGTGSGGDDARTYSVGVTQIAAHPSLDASLVGFKAALEDAGLDVEYDEENAQGDQSTAISIASGFASAGHDLVLAIATPTAQAAAQAITDVPILITAVTEPEAAGLVDSWDAPGGNLTGTSDLNPVAEQLGLLAEIAPDVQTVGIVYSSGEVNSEVQVELAQEAAAELGIEIETAAITNSGEVQQAADSLDVDAFYVPTDNTVIQSFEALLQVAESKSLPLVSADGDTVERGAIATYGIDYEQLGYQTGEMAVQILTGGADPAEMPIETLEEWPLIVNPAAAERMGVELPAELVERADTVIE